MNGLIIAIAIAVIFLLILDTGLFKEHVNILSFNDVDSIKKELNEWNEWLVKNDKIEIERRIKNVTPDQCVAIQKQVNEWLAKNDTIEIVKRLQNVTPGQCVIITIFYKNK